MAKPRINPEEAILLHKSMSWDKVAKIMKCHTESVKKVVRQHKAKQAE